MSKKRTRLSPEEIRERLGEAHRRVRELKSLIAQRREEKCNGTIQSVGRREVSPLGDGMLSSGLPRRVLRGHYSKIYSVAWSGSLPVGEYTAHDILSVDNNGHMVVWNSLSGLKRCFIEVPKWAMACDFERTASRLVASGGLDNEVCVYQLEDNRSYGDSKSPPSARLAGHDGYISDIKFIGQDALLSSSGDSTVILWDVQRSVGVHQYADHSSDCSSVSVNPVNDNTFVTGSCDMSAKLWDRRERKCFGTFIAHVSDVNCVSFLPNGNCFATGSMDGTCNVFDMRSCSVPLVSFLRVGDSASTQVSSMDVSHTGRLIFTGYVDKVAMAWDILSSSTNAHGSCSTAVACFEHHDPTTTSKVQAGGSGGAASEQHVHLAVNATGQALCTGAWDSVINVRPSRGRASGMCALIARSLARSPPQVWA